MLYPFDPNRFRSRRTEWNTHRPKMIPLSFPSDSSIISLSKLDHARFMFARSPAGGSFVSLMHRARIPMGIALEGSEERNTRMRSWEPSMLNESSFFSSSMSHTGIK